MLFQPSSEPVHVDVVLFDHSSMMTLASVIDPMRAANRLAQRSLFHWALATPDGSAAQLTCGLSIQPDQAVGQLAGGDLLVLVAGFEVSSQSTKRLEGRIRQLAKSYKMLAGIEAGAWLLGRAGLLAELGATTHWEDLEEFASQMPDTDVMPDRYVVDGNMITTGGASPTFDLMLHLIRQRYGYPLAQEVASVFIYDQAREKDEAQPQISLGRLNQTSPNVARSIGIMEAHIDRPLTISAISKQVGLAQRTYEHQFRQALGVSPGAYFLRLRLQFARKLLLNTALPALEIAMRTGFGSASSFSTIFKKHYGLSPQAYRIRKRNGQEVAQSL